MGNAFESCDVCNKRGDNLEKTQTNESVSESGDDDDASSQADEGEKNEEKIPDNLINLKINSDQLVMEREESPWKFYEEIDDIGSGTFGYVKKVRLIKNNSVIRALKIIPKENVLEGVNTSSVLDEITILKKLDHPNIMKVYECFVDDKNFYIVSEFCDQGDLYGKIQKVGKMSEIVVGFIMGQVFQAVAYLHSQNILHGDIKMENILLYRASSRGGRKFTDINKDFNKFHKLTQDIKNNYRTKKAARKSICYVDDMLNYEVKLIDFGCSKMFKKKKRKLKGVIGTSMYCSPEVINNRYTDICDEWSCGVLMYMLLCGEAPFEGETEEEIFNNIKKKRYDFSKSEFSSVSDSCKDLISKLMEPNIKNRIKAIDALRHPFFTGGFDPSKAMTEKKDLSLLNKIVHLHYLPSKFHEAVFAYLSTNFVLTDEETKIRELFRYMDEGNKNLVSKDDVKRTLKEINITLSDEEIDKIFNYLDSNGSGYLEYQEFIRAVCDKESLLSENNVKGVFLTISGGKDEITQSDIKKFIFHDSKINDTILKEYFEQFGMKEEDKINFNDFYDMIKNGTLYKKPTEENSTHSENDTQAPSERQDIKNGTFTEDNSQTENSTQSEKQDKLLKRLSSQLKNIPVISEVDEEKSDREENLLTFSSQPSQPSQQEEKDI